jgi:hypothetical protein
LNSHSNPSMGRFEPGPAGGSQPDLETHFNVRFARHRTPVGEVCTGGIN